MEDEGRPFSSFPSFLPSLLSPSFCFSWRNLMCSWDSENRLIQMCFHDDITCEFPPPPPSADVASLNPSHPRTPSTSSSFSHYSPPFFSFPSLLILLTPARFLRSWKDYLVTIEEQEVVRGRPLPAAEKKKLTDQQKGSLKKLKEAAKEKEDIDPLSIGNISFEKKSDL